MIIPAARPNPGRKRVAGSASVPAPTGGWNARDALDGMKTTDAIQLDNFFPDTDSIRLRKGYAEHATGLTTSSVESLFVHAGVTAQKMIGIADGEIYDVSASGAVGAALATGFTNSRFQECQIGGYTLLFNGSDNPQKFDGSSVTSNSITGSGLTSSNLIYPWVFKRRVFVVEKNSLNVWYLGLDAITGSASKLDFSTICQLGGYMVAGGTWTRDGGSGSDDYCIFITSMGEVMVYHGTDPGDPAEWALVGVFRIGPPVGQRPLLRMGSDLIVISVDGFSALSRVLPIDRAGSSAASLSDKIRNAVKMATQSHSGKFGWQAVHYPRGTYAFVNVPIAETETAHQYVMNTITGNWCKFTGQNANCWAIYDDEIYFGSQSGVVYKADTGASDNGSNIVGDIQPAFNYFGSRGRQKRFTMIRPITASDGAVSFTYALNVDYSDKNPTTTSTGTTSGTQWDSGYWDTFYWAGDANIQRKWLTVSGVGYSASPHIRVSTSTLTLAINSIDYIFEVGGIL